MKLRNLFIVLLVFGLTSCEETLPEDENPTNGDEFTYQNGTYVATYDQSDYFGGKAFLKFTLTDDQIKDVDFDYTNQTGDRLSQGAVIPCLTVDPNTLIPDIENAIANASIIPDYTEIDIIAQAEKETGDANELAKAILSNALEGNIDTIFIAQIYLGSFSDGTFRAEFSEPDGHSWKAFLQFDLNDDDISNVDFDYLDVDGNRKSEDQQYNDAMYEWGGITKPEWYVVDIESKIDNISLEIKTPICNEYANEIDVVTGATAATSDANYLFQQAIISAIKGETNTVLVPHRE